MSQISDIVLSALKELLPLSVVNEVASFVFYDEHPRDERSLDVTICTKRGVVQEFFQRELLDSILLENIRNVEEIGILRNSRCELFYLVAAKNELVIISKKEKLQIHKIIKNVQSYELEDLECRGQASLKIVLKDDAVPLIFDDNFEKLRETPLAAENVTSEESLPVVNQLIRKLNEAKYTTKCNETTLKEYLQLRQMAAFSIYQRTDVNVDKSLFKLSQSEISNALQVKSDGLIVKCCNNKIIIISHILNSNKVPITDITVLLHGTSKQSLVYTTRVFNQIPRSPYWTETSPQIDDKKESTVVAIIDLKEVRDNTMCRIDFDAVLSFNKEGKSYLLPLGSVKVSALDIMGKNFDMLSNEGEDNTILLLALLATSEKNYLRLRHIKNPGDDLVTLPEIFCAYLEMESLSMENIAIYKKSPQHILYGVMIIFQEYISELNHVMNIEVYSRSHSQALALIQYMYDTVPYTIIATTPEYKLTSITNNLNKYNEEMELPESHLNTKDCLLSLQKQSKMLKEYFDSCVIQMSENKNTEIEDKVGLEIDITALGVQKYLEFRMNFLDESIRGVESLFLEQEPIYVHSDSSTTTTNELLTYEWN